MTRTATDLAADSPLTYDELHAAKTAGTLAGTLASLTPRDRVGAAALVAERMGRDVSSVLAVFGRLIDEAAALAALEAEQAVMANPADTADFYAAQARALAALDTYGAAKRERQQGESADELLVAPAPTDEQLIAQAGGRRANPFTVRETLDGELLVVDRRTSQIVDRCDRYDARAHTMGVVALRLWLAELRAARPEPTPPAPSSPRVLWRFGGTAAALRQFIASRAA